MGSELSPRKKCKQRTVTPPTYFKQEKKCCVWRISQDSLLSLYTEEYPVSFLFHSHSKWTHGCFYFLFCNTSILSQSELFVMSPSLLLLPHFPSLWTVRFKHVFAPWWCHRISRRSTISRTIPVDSFQARLWQTHLFLGRPVPTAYFISFICQLEQKWPHRILLPVLHRWQLLSPRLNTDWQQSTCRLEME